MGYEKTRIYVDDDYFLLIIILLYFLYLFCLYLYFKGTTTRLFVPGAFFQGNDGIR